MDWFSKWTRKKASVSLNPGLHQQVHLVLLAEGDVGEDLLVHGDDGGVGVEGGGDVGEEEMEELGEEGAEEFFEQAVVIHRRKCSGLSAPAFFQ